VLKSAERVTLRGWRGVVDLAIFAETLGAAETALEVGFVMAADLVKTRASVLGLRLWIC
jgi:hypothetical protein